MSLARTILRMFSQTQDAYQNRNLDQEILRSTNDVCRLDLHTVPVYWTDLWIWDVSQIHKMAKVYLSRVCSLTTGINPWKMSFDFNSASISLARYRCYLLIYRVLEILIGSFFWATTTEFSGFQTLFQLYNSSSLSFFCLVLVENFQCFNGHNSHGSDVLKLKESEFVQVDFDRAAAPLDVVQRLSGDSDSPWSPDNKNCGNPPKPPKTKTFWRKKNTHIFWNILKPLL